jgi:Cdc6-like AAA superfamily ATPase
MDIKQFAVPPDQLKRECDPNIFKFKCTQDLAPLKEFIGQERAIRGIEFGLNMDNRGYNIYVAGLTGTGKTSIVKAYVNKIVQKRQAEAPYSADDWCYLYNFK